jgi:hypothetical protein
MTHSVISAGSFAVVHNHLDKWTDQRGAGINAGLLLRLKRENPDVAAGVLSQYVCIRLLFERGGNAAERGVQVRPERLYSSDDRNRNAGGDETVFNGGCGGFIAEELQN